VWLGADLGEQTHPEQTPGGEGNGKELEQNIMGSFRRVSWQAVRGPGEQHVPPGTALEGGDPACPGGCRKQSVPVGTSGGGLHRPEP